MQREACAEEFDTLIQSRIISRNSTHLRLDPVLADGVLRVDELLNHMQQEPNEKLHSSYQRVNMSQH